ncbi:uncharacterized protein EMH_0065740 [Eimeria mitis]|uniref:Uncharacterized protein n=1 Tax=Eimeria mitis TaxID=44415 RepID=U6K4S8_9EIME|nr:uncharacterized protein EMH_0065740 [Eimeria mitis]CDJ31322.1 hypothetical protein EMH_0065740 [Eimeria mitis]
MMKRGPPSSTSRPGGPPFLSPLLVSLDPPGGLRGGPQVGPPGAPPTETDWGAEGPPVLPRLQQQQLQQQRSLRLWLQKAKRQQRQTQRQQQEHPLVGPFPAVSPCGGPRRQRQRKRRQTLQRETSSWRCSIS